MRIVSVQMKARLRTAPLKAVVDRSFSAPVGFVDRGDALVVPARERVRGEGSGVEIERELGQVFHLRGAGVVEHVEYPEWRAALEQ